MPIVSVITAVHPPSTRHIHDAYRSLAAQALPDGWEWEWLVQQDGAECGLRALLPDEPRIKIGRNPKSGPGPTRSTALSRASGNLIKALDADDILAPGALGRDIDTLLSFDVKWTTSSALDLLPDGSLESFDSDPERGVIARGAVVEHWRTHDYRLPVHPATLCIERDLVVALGGWFPLPTSEDTGLLLSANTVTDGYFIDEVGLYYRKWPGQATQSAAHNDPAARAARAHVIEARLHELHPMSTP
jgi:glycosyltransferase involved in cell wall biosynthesis